MQTESTVEKRLLTATSLGHLLCHVSMLTFPAVLAPISEEYGLSLTEVTAVGTLTYLLFGLGALPAGFLAGVSSAKLTLTLFFLGTGASVVLIALAPSFPPLRGGDGPARHLREHVPRVGAHPYFALQ